LTGLRLFALKCILCGIYDGNYLIMVHVLLVVIHIFNIHPDHLSDVNAFRPTYEGTVVLFHFIVMGLYYAGEESQTKAAHALSVVRFTVRFSQHVFAGGI
jgi:hypothetical protein